MIVQYGDYSFNNGECSLVNFSAKAIRGINSVKHRTVVTAQCAGEFCFSGAYNQDTIKNRIVAARAAFAEDYQDFKVLHNDGTTESPYVLINNHSQNVTGNVVLYESWPGNEPEDYASTKQFAFGIKAEFINPESTLLDFKQNLRITGTAGPVKRWSRLTGATWQVRQVHASSTKSIIQTGYAIAFGAYPMAATPVLPEIYEHLERRVISQEGPSLYYARPDVYKKTWRYVFETPFEFTWTPNYPSIF